MKKYLKILSLIVCAAIAGIAAACSSDDPDGSLSGVYGCEYTSDGYGSCYYFQNSNTVIYYGSAHKGETNGSNGKLGAHQKIGSSNWYCCDGESGRSYTYTMADNKVYIPMKGTILTKSGNTLTEDGGSTYRK